MGNMSIMGVRGVRDDMINRGVMGVRGNISNWGTRGQGCYKY